MANSKIKSVQQVESELLEKHEQQLNSEVDNSEVLAKSADRWKEWHEVEYTISKIYIKF